MVWYLGKLLLTSMQENLISLHVSNKGHRQAPPFAQSYQRLFYSLSGQDSTASPIIASKAVPHAINTHVLTGKTNVLIRQFTCC